MMALSELTTILESKAKTFSLKKSPKLYYRKFPNCIRLNFKWANLPERRRSFESQVTRENAAHIKRAGINDGIRARHEWNEVQFYFSDFDKISNLLENWTLSGFDITLETMDQREINAATEVKQDLPKAEVRLVNRLPFYQYRYRIYLAASPSTLRKVGRESIEAIIHHINTNETCRGLTEYEMNSLLAMRRKHGRYFYSENEDILSLINLIDSRIVSKIEKFITREEIGGQHSTDISDDAA